MIFCCCTHTHIYYKGSIYIFLSQRIISTSFSKHSFTSDTQTTSELFCFTNARRFSEARKTPSFLSLHSLQIGLKLAKSSSLSTTSSLLHRQKVFWHCNHPVKSLLYIQVSAICLQPLTTFVTSSNGVHLKDWGTGP